MIILDKDYCIDADEFQYILKKKRVAKADAKEPGKVTWEANGYFNSISQAVKHYYNLQIKAEIVKNDYEISGLLMLLDKYEKSFEEKLHEFTA